MKAAASLIILASPFLWSQIWSEVWELHRPCFLLWYSLCSRWALKPAWWRVWSKPSTFWQASITRLYLTWLLMYCRRRRKTDRAGLEAEVAVIVRKQLSLFTYIFCYCIYFHFTIERGGWGFLLFLSLYLFNSHCISIRIQMVLFLLRKIHHFNGSLSSEYIWLTLNVRIHQTQRWGKAPVLEM